VDDKKHRREIYGERKVDGSNNVPSRQEAHEEGRFHYLFQNPKHPDYKEYRQHQRQIKEHSLPHWGNGKGNTQGDTK